MRHRKKRLIMHEHYWQEMASQTIVRIMAAVSLKQKIKILTHEVIRILKKIASKKYHGRAK